MISLIRIPTSTKKTATTTTTQDFPPSAPTLLPLEFMHTPVATVTLGCHTTSLSFSFFTLFFHNNLHRFSHYHPFAAIVPLVAFRSLGLHLTLHVPHPSTRRVGLHWLLWLRSLPLPLQLVLFQLGLLTLVAHGFLYNLCYNFGFNSWLAWILAPSTTSSTSLVCLALTLNDNTTHFRQLPDLQLAPSCGTWLAWILAPSTSSSTSVVRFETTA